MSACAAPQNAGLLPHAPLQYQTGPQCDMARTLSFPRPAYLLLCAAMVGCGALAALAAPLGLGGATQLRVTHAPATGTVAGALHARTAARAGLAGPAAQPAPAPGALPAVTLRPQSDPEAPGAPRAAPPPTHALMAGALALVAGAFAWTARTLGPQRRGRGGVLAPLRELHAGPPCVAMAATSAEAPGPTTPSAPAEAPKFSKIRNSLTIPQALREFWYPCAFSRDLTQDTLMPFDMFADSWLLFRNEKGEPACLLDECAHRACPLSLGKLKEGQVECPYHGWTFNGEGSCTKMPSTVFRPHISVDTRPVREADGFVWVWMGEGAPDEELPTYTQAPEGFTVLSEQIFDVPTEHGLLLENLLDLAHAPFTHTSTFAKGWPIPGSVKFRTTDLLAGNWDPYPIDMAFAPPCGVLSTIGINKPGDIERGMKASQCDRHLWQLHVCLPTSEGKTRLLYRMGLDFWGFTKQIPLLDNFWRSVADQVLSEDLKLIQGQQLRMEKDGSDVWANPVSYDKLAVRYRRWRNSLEDQDLEARRRIEEELARPFSAGELFTEGEATQPRAEP